MHFAELYSSHSFPDFMFSLNVTRIDVLSSVRHGQPLPLKCVYRLNRGEEFKGIRWYKDDDLIFSYATSRANSDPEPFKYSYNVDDLEIDASIPKTLCLIKDKFK